MPDYTFKKEEWEEIIKDKSPDWIEGLIYGLQKATEIFKWTQKITHNKIQAPNTK